MTFLFNHFHQKALFVSIIPGIMNGDVTLISGLKGLQQTFQKPLLQVRLPHSGWKSFILIAMNIYEQIIVTIGSRR